MSWNVMQMVFNSTIPGVERMILLVLAKHAQDDGTNAYPSIETIVEQSGFTTRTVQANIRTLEAFGILERAGITKYMTTNYTIRLDRIPQQVQEMQGGAVAAGVREMQGGAVGAQGGAGNAPNRVLKEIKENNIGGISDLSGLRPDPKPFVFGNAQAIDIYCQVTGHMAIPSGKAAEAENMIGVILMHHKTDCVEYLRPFFAAWTKRGYNPSNVTGWLDWAITGSVPAEKTNGNGNGNGNGHKPTLEERNQAIFDRVLARRAAEENEDDE